MAIRIRAFLRSRRRHLTTLVAVAVLAGLLLAAHGALADGHMDEGYMGDAVTMCLAIAEVAAVALGTTMAAAGAAALLNTVPFPMVLLPPTNTSPMRVPAGAARASPSFLQVFRH